MPTWKFLVCAFQLINSLDGYHSPSVCALTAGNPHRRSLVGCDNFPILRPYAAQSISQHRPRITFELRRTPILLTYGQLTDVSRSKQRLFIQLRHFPVCLGCLGVSRRLLVLIERSLNTELEDVCITQKPVDSEKKNRKTISIFRMASVRRNIS